MSNNVAPDSWDETEESAAELQQKLIKLNVNAVEFVPSFGTPASAKAEEDNENENAGSSSDKKPAGTYRI